MTELSVKVAGLLPLKKQLKLLAMPLTTRRRVLNKIGKAIVSNSKKRVGKQVDVDGKPLAARWRKRKDRRKMLSRLSKQMTVTTLNGVTATIGWNRGNSGYIAAKQQFGAIEKIEVKAKGGAAKKADGKATKPQAVELRKLGFKLKKGGKLTAVSLKWMMENLSIAQAGSIIRSMRTKQGTGSKTSWTTTLPARAVFGASEPEIADYVDAIFEQAVSDINRVRA